MAKHSVVEISMEKVWSIKRLTGIILCFLCVLFRMSSLFSRDFPPLPSQAPQQPQQSQDFHSPDFTKLQLGVDYFITYNPKGEATRVLAADFEKVRAQFQQNNAFSPPHQLEVVQDMPLLLIRLIEGSPSRMKIHVVAEDRHFGEEVKLVADMETIIILTTTMIVVVMQGSSVEAPLTLPHHPHLTHKLCPLLVIQLSPFSPLFLRKRTVNYRSQCRL